MQLVLRYDHNVWFKWKTCTGGSQEKDTGVSSAVCKTQYRLCHCIDWLINAVKVLSYLDPPWNTTWKGYDWQQLDFSAWNEKWVANFVLPLFGNTVVRLTLTLPKIWTGNSRGRAGLLLITGYISLGNILALSCSSVHPSMYKCVRMLEHFLSFLGTHVTVHLLLCVSRGRWPA